MIIKSSKRDKYIKKHNTELRNEPTYIYEACQITR